MTFYIVNNRQLDAVVAAAYAAGRFSGTFRSLFYSAKAELLHSQMDDRIIEFKEVEIPAQVRMVRATDHSLNYEWGCNVHWSNDIAHPFEEYPPRPDGGYISFAVGRFNLTDAERDAIDKAVDEDGK